VAIGAYNWGEGAMYRAILDSHQQLGYVVYEKLPLRQITANYVPKLIALSHIIKDPNRFGINLPYVENKSKFKIVKPMARDSVKNFIKNSQISNQMFYKLNPQFVSINTMIDTTENIAIPHQNYNIYLASIDKYYNDKNDEIKVLDFSVEQNNELALDIHKDTPKNNEEDTIASIIDDTNIIDNTNSKIPISHNNDMIVTRANNNENRIIKPKLQKYIPNYANEKTIQKYHIIKKGDTLYSISKKYNINLSKIIDLNNIKNYNIALGQKIKLY
jgi:membrane-bound lytic murein transglycosylase D